jgi:hypothetical protein
VAQDAWRERWNWPTRSPVLRRSDAPEPLSRPSDDARQHARERGALAFGDLRAYQNKAVVYDLLFKASAETTLTIAADPKHLGARIGFMSVLHTWGSALTHHPHVHMVVPGGGLSPDGSRWIACRPRYFLTVEVLSALFRRLFLQMLVAAHHAGRLQFFGDHARLADKAAFKAYLRPLRKIDWVVYAQEPFAGPRQVVRYLSRYTRRIAISNRRLLSADPNGVTFRYKDSHRDQPDRSRWEAMAWLLVPLNHPSVLLPLAASRGSWRQAHPRLSSVRLGPRES